MADNSNILRYLKDEGPAVAQLAQLGLKHDIVSFARSVMVSNTQKRLVDPAFPPELRLLVLKAGVPKGTTCSLQTTLSRSWRTIEDLRNLAYNMLLSPARKYWYQRDPWADQEISDLMRSTAEQAFLETVMFEIDLTGSFATLRHNSASIASPPLLRSTGAHISGDRIQDLTTGARIHYLHLSVAISGSTEDGIIAFTACRGAATCMESLKLHFRNIKACILTFHIRASPPIHSLLPFQPFDRDTLRWHEFQNPDTMDTVQDLASEIAALSDVYSVKGPGKSQFVRIRQNATRTSEPYYYGPLVSVDCSKMAMGSQNGSLGARLLKDAYRLERTEPRSEQMGRC